MKLLAIDTSTERLSLAAQNGERIATHQGVAGAQASAGLIQAVLDVLKQAHLSLDSLQAIAFGRGPGAFTGLRTACSVSQGLALGLGIPLLPVDTLMCMAEATRPEHTRVLAVLDARMGQVYHAAYERSTRGWTGLYPAQLSRPDELTWPSHWQSSSALLAGNAVTSLQADLQHLLLPPHTSQELWPDACAMLRLAGAAWDRGDRVSAHDAAPLYVRDEVARTTVQRLADKLNRP
jgi:tRNA threonylcarbamoyladenosine biosynthesis protein TsaB